MATELTAFGHSGVARLAMQDSNDCIQTLFELADAIERASARAVQVDDKRGVNSTFKIHNPALRTDWTNAVTPGQAAATRGKGWQPRSPFGKGVQRNKGKGYKGKSTGKGKFKGKFVNAQFQAPRATAIRRCPGQGCTEMLTTKRMRVVCEPCFQRSLIAPIRLNDNRFFPERKGAGKGKGKGSPYGTRSFTTNPSRSHFRPQVNALDVHPRPLPVERASKRARSAAPDSPRPTVPGMEVLGVTDIPTPTIPHADQQEVQPISLQVHSAGYSRRRGRSLSRSTTTASSEESRATVRTLASATYAREGSPGGDHTSADAAHSPISVTSMITHAGSEASHPADAYLVQQSGGTTGHGMLPASSGTSMGQQGPAPERHLRMGDPNHPIPRLRHSLYEPNDDPDRPTKWESVLPSDSRMKANSTVPTMPTAPDTSLGDFETFKSPRALPRSQVSNPNPDPDPLKSGERVNRGSMRGSSTSQELTSTPAQVDRWARRDPLLDPEARSSPTPASPPFVVLDPTFSSPNPYNRDTHFNDYFSVQWDRNSPISERHGEEETPPALESIYPVQVRSNTVGSQGQEGANGFHVVAPDPDPDPNPVPVSMVTYQPPQPPSLRVLADIVVNTHGVRRRRYGLVGGSEHSDHEGLSSPEITYDTPTFAQILMSLQAEHAHSVFGAGDLLPSPDSPSEHGGGNGTGQYLVHSVEVAPIGAASGIVQFNTADPVTGKPLAPSGVWKSRRKSLNQCGPIERDSASLLASLGVKSDPDQQSSPSNYMAFSKQGPPAFPPAPPARKRLFEGTEDRQEQQVRRKVLHGDQRRVAYLDAMVAAPMPIPTPDAATDHVTAVEFDRWWELQDYKNFENWEVTEGGPTDVELESLPSGSAPMLPPLPHPNSTSPFYYDTSSTHPQYANTVPTSTRGMPRSLDDAFDITLAPTTSFTSLGSLGSLDAGLFEECFGDGGELPLFDDEGELTHGSNQAVDVPEYLACFDQSSTGTTARQVAIDMGLGEWVSDLQDREENLRCTEVYPLTPPALRSPPKQASNATDPDVQAAQALRDTVGETVHYCTTDDEVYYTVDNATDDDVCYVKTVQRKCT